MMVPMIANVNFAPYAYENARMNLRARYFKKVGLSSNCPIEHDSPLLSGRTAAKLTLRKKAAGRRGAEGGGTEEEEKVEEQEEEEELAAGCMVEGQTRMEAA